MTTVRISDDALAIACGAERVARRFAELGCEVIRTSSWGMHWLEPLVEIDGIGFGPVGIGDVEGVLAITLSPSGRGSFASARSPITPSSPPRPA